VDAREVKAEDVELVKRRLDGPRDHLHRPRKALRARDGERDAARLDARLLRNKSEDLGAGDRVRPTLKLSRRGRLQRL
jgi:hypothetical protein